MASTSGVVNTSDFAGRYLVFSWALTSQDATSNKSTISWSLRGAGAASAQYYESGDFLVTIDGEAIFSSSARIRLYNGTIVSSGTIELLHDEQGERSFVVEVAVAIFEEERNVSGEGSFELPNISRYASLITVSDFTDEENPVIIYTNPTSGAVKIELKAGESIFAERELAGTISPYTLVLTSQERVALRDASPDSNELELTCALSTLSGDTVIHTDEAQVKMSIVNALPLISGVLFWDANTITTAITQNEQQFIQNKSLLSVKVGSLSAIKGAELERLEITANNSTISQVVSGASASDITILYGTINSASDTALKVRVYDTRGNYSEYTREIVVYPWEMPSANIECSRAENNDSLVRVYIEASFSYIAGKNELTKKIRYKEEGGTWSAFVTVSGSSISLSLSSSRYSFEITLEDKLAVVTYQAAIDKAEPIVFIDKSLRSVGVACFPENENSLEVQGFDILNELFFHDGELVDFSGINTSGYITSNNDEIVFSLALGKDTRFISSVSFSELKINVRGVSGLLISAAGGYDMLNDSNITVSAQILKNYITITCACASSPAWRETDDTPLSIEIVSALLTMEE